MSWKLEKKRTVLDKEKMSLELEVDRDYFFREWDFMMHTYRTAVTKIKQYEIKFLENKFGRGESEYEARESKKNWSKIGKKAYIDIPKLIEWAQINFILDEEEIEKYKSEYKGLEEENKEIFSCCCNCKN